MSVDKKVQAGKLRLVLLKQLGEAVVTGDVPATVLDETLNAARAAAKSNSQDLQDYAD